jgi:hypothetical protein
MKRILTIAAVNLAAVGAWAQVYTTNSYNLTSTGTAAIPDGNLAGVMETFNVSGVGSLQSIANVQLSLDIAGGYNGDLYAYLTGPGGQLAVLLNRVGVSQSANNLTGYANPGFYVTFDDAGLNIHGYGNTPPVNGNGQVTGTWAPDGRNINPQSTPGVFDSASTAANFAVFNGLNNGSLNGSWTLFLADVVADGFAPTLNLNDATLTITTVPEPQTMALAISGGLVLLAATRRRR